MRFDRRLIPSLLLVLLGTLAYANSLHAPFVFDDIENICVNPAVHSFSGSEWFHGVASRRVLIFTFALNYAWGGLNPAGYHLVNLGIHVCAGLVLWRLLAGVLRERVELGEPDLHGKLAWFTAAVWLVHPLQTESVTYLVQRAESLMGLCFLLVLWLVMRGVKSARPIGWYLAAVLFTWLGMGTKEVMVTVLPVVLLMDRVLWSPTWRELFTRRGGLYLGMLLAIGFYFRPVSHVIVGGSTSAGFGCVERTAWEHLLSQSHAILLYLRLAVWPWPQCFDYCLPTVRHLSEAILPGLVVIALLIVGGWGVYHRRLWSIPLAAFFLVLAPTSSIVPLQDVAAEHRMYLPLAGVLSLVIVGGYITCRQVAISHELQPSWRAALTVLAATVTLLATTIGTIARNHTYQDECTLWTEVVRVRPQSSRAHNNLGAALIEREEFDLAQVHLQQAWRLAAPHERASIEYNLARSYLGQRRPREAQEILLRLVTAEPRQPELRYHLAAAHLMLGEPTAAIEQLQMVLEQKPNWPRAIGLLGESYLAANRREEAIECLSTGQPSIGPPSVTK